MFAKIQKSAMGMAYQLEVETGIRKATSNCKSKSTLHSLGKHLKAVQDKWKKVNGMSDADINARIDNKAGGNPAQKQTCMESFYGSVGCS